MGSKNAPTLITVAVATAASLAAILLGGPRTGYLPGIVVSTGIVVAITWRYKPSQRTRWLATILLVSYHFSGTMMVGGDVLAHVSVGNSVLRYDRGLHVFGATVAVLLIAEGWNQSRFLSRWLVLALALAAGFAVEAVELFTALVAPSWFSYDLYDSSLDVAGNTLGAISCTTALVWIHRTEARRRHSPAT